MFPYFVVHDWLGELWLINFIVAIFSITNDIQNNILFELGLVFNSQLDCSIYVFYIF